jgi:P27 family predicted phage terminase small subunit
MAGRKGRSGRPPKSRGLHIVDDTHRPARHGDREEAKRELVADRQSSTPKAPAGLNAVARAEWRRLARTLHHRGDLTPRDRAVFAAYCQAWAEFIAAERSVKAQLEQAKARLKMDPLDAEARWIVAYDGRVVPGRDGNWTRHPATLLLNAAAKRLRETASEFGLTPIARARHAAADPKGKGRDSRDFPEELGDDAAEA